MTIIYMTIINCHTRDNLYDLLDKTDLNENRKSKRVATINADITSGQVISVHRSIANRTNEVIPTGKRCKQHNGK